MEIITRAEPYHTKSSRTLRRRGVFKLLTVIYAGLFLVFMSLSVQAAPNIPLDPTFGNGGKLIIDFENRLNFGKEILIQPDGKVLIVGYSLTQISGLSYRTFVSMLRFNADGTVDGGFANSGLLIDETGGHIVEGAALQPDGKIVCAGWVDLNRLLRMSRYNSNGTLDTSFGDNGNIYGPAGFQTIDVAVQADGKIVVLGNVYNGTYFGFGVRRYNNNGSLDTDFGASGEALAVFNGEHVNSGAIRVQADGKIVVAGRVTDHPCSGCNADFALARFNANGSLDAGFGAGGRVTTDFNGGLDEAFALIIQPDGKLLVGGRAPLQPASTLSAFAMARYNGDGSLDTSFGVGGKVTTAFVAGSYITGLALHADGRISAAGVVALTPSDNDCALARYSSTGSLIAQTQTVFTGDETAASVAVLPDGKTLIAGRTSIPNADTNFAIARYLDATVPTAQPSFDFDGDNKSDIAVYRPGSSPNAPSYWYVLQSGTNTLRQEQFGNGEDRIAPVDFSGDGRADFAVFRPSTGTWYTSLNPVINYGALQWGTTGDIPVPGDYDGDLKADHAVFRPSNGYWYVRRSSDGGFIFQQFGTSADKPLLADFDGDGKTDFAFVRSVGLELFWHVRQSASGLVITQQFGLASDKAVPADYDGDGRTNFAVFRPSTSRWYTSTNPATNYGEIAWGQNGDVPAPADYDSDGKADVTVFRPSGGTWYILRSTDGGIIGQQWGISTDTPVPSAFIR